MADITLDQTADDLRKQQEAEYGTYVASEPIFFDGALAFNPGDPVPVGHVKKYGLSGAVKKVAEAEKKS